MKNIKKHVVRIGFAAIALSMFLSVALSVENAYAASAIIEAAKDDCIVGEQADGYLGVVSGASPSDAVRREVAPHRGHEMGHAKIPEHGHT